MRGLIAETCASDADALASSPFCACCVSSQLHAITDECVCQPFILNTDRCFYAMNGSARQKARDAIQYANSVCAGRKPRLPWAVGGNVDACQAPVASEPIDGGRSRAHHYLRTGCHAVHWLSLDTSSERVRDDEQAGAGAHATRSATTGKRRSN